MKDDLINKADEEERMDALFREGLDGQRIEPSRSLWKEISRKLLWREILRLNFTNLSRTVLVGGAGVLAILSTVTYLAIWQSPAGEVKELNNNAVVPGHSVSEVTAAVKAVAPIKPAPPASGNSFPDRDYSSQRITGSVLSSKSSTHETVILQAEEPSQNLLISNTASTQKVFLPSITKLESMDVRELSKTPACDTLIIVTPTEIIKINRENQLARQFFSVTLGVTPEVAFYQSPDAYSKVNFWINAGITFHISRFSIGLTPGLGLVNDDGIYKIDYKSKDSIGFYNSVVSYTINPVTNQIVYNTEKRNIYDSVMHVADDRTRDRYTYLQIPLLLGYRFIETNRLSLTIEAGPAVSFLIGRRESAPAVDYPNARIIKVENNTPTRVETNWQVWAGLNLEYRLSKSVSFFCAPVYKYYLSPIFEKEGVSYSKPWSVGLGVGLQVNFGQKRRQP